jgi:hypothetical protein
VSDARAGWYGALIIEWYGPAHDAYRPAFRVADRGARELVLASVGR